MDLISSPTDDKYAINRSGLSTTNRRLTVEAELRLKAVDEDIVVDGVNRRDVDSDQNSDILAVAKCSF